ncbi:hypothetical protein SFRURICE_020045, partial [Spodoptera frugiperda]
MLYRKYSITNFNNFLRLIPALPPIAPVLKADKDRYQPGELRSSETSLHPSESGLLWTSVKADVKVTPELFLGGRLRVACLATVYDVYRSSANLDFFTPDTDPRPERSKYTLATNNTFLA